MNAPIQPKRKEIGQSMVELALMITVLMVLLAGTIDLGHAFFTWLAMRDAAQEGVAYGSYDKNIPEGSIESYAVSLVKADVVKDPSALITADAEFIGNRCLGYHPDPNAATLLKANSIELRVVYSNFPISMPFLGALIGDTITIRAKINGSILAPVCTN